MADNRRIHPTVSQYVKKCSVVLFTVNGEYPQAHLLETGSLSRVHYRKKFLHLKFLQYQEMTWQLKVNTLQNILSGLCVYIDIFVYLWKHWQAGLWFHSKVQFLWCSSVESLVAGKTFRGSGAPAFILFHIRSEKFNFALSTKQSPCLLLWSLLLSCVFK